MAQQYFDRTASEAQEVVPAQEVADREKDVASEFDARPQLGLCPFSASLFFIL